tara:strand:- start:244 stop:1173 length:930 start_codon:yes stop_codon:yes gene_type:complete
MNEQIRLNPQKEVETAVFEINKRNVKFINDLSNIKSSDKNIIYNLQNNFPYYKHPSPPGLFIDNNYSKNNKIYNNLTFKDITIVVSLKNRRERFKLFYSFIKKHIVEHNIKIIFVEGKSDNQIDTTLFNGENNVSYYIVDIGNVWSRSVLLNYGILKSETEIILLSDIDFIYPKLFWDTFEYTINRLDLNNSFIGFPLFETFDTRERKKFTPYSSCYLIKKDLIVKYGGFNCKMINFSLEERELQQRLYLNNIATIYTCFAFPNTYVLHYSHESSLGRDNLKRNENNLNVYNETIRNNIKKIEFKISLE